MTLSQPVMDALNDLQRKAFALDAMVAAGRISKRLADEATDFARVASKAGEYTPSAAVRAELHRLSEIADSVDPLVIRLGEVTTELERANALLREAIEWNWLDDDAPQQAGVNTDDPSPMDELYASIQSHLQGADDEA